MSGETGPDSRFESFISWGNQARIRIEELVGDIYRNLRDFVVRNEEKFPTLLLRYAYFFVAGAFGFIAAAMVPLLFFYIGILASQTLSPTGGPLGTISIEIALLGLGGVVGTTYVFIARFGFWFRRELIRYWKSRTLPFQEYPYPEQRAHSIERIPADTRKKSTHYMKKNVVYGVLSHFFGWGFIFMVGTTDLISTEALLRYLELTLQSVAVVFGGIPALAGVVITTSELASFFPTRSGALLVIFTVLIPALFFAVAARSAAYMAEFKFHQLWRKNRERMFIYIVAYLLLFAVAGLQTLFPGFLPSL